MRQPRALVLGACLVVITASVLAGLGAHSVFAVHPPVIIKGHLVPALQHRTPKGPTDGHQAMHLEIALQLHDESALPGLIQQLNDPKSPIYHHWLTPQQFEARFAPTQSDVNSVTAFLQSQGLLVSSVAANRLLIDASGSVSTVESAFHTQISDYDLNGQTVFAPTEEPTVPDNIASLIKGINGLNNIPRHRHDSLTALPRATATNVSHPSTVIAYTPDQIRTAYDIAPLTAAGNTGSGQTLALVELDGYTSSDIDFYQSTYGLHATYSNVLVDGATNIAGANAFEDELDMEVSAAVAPNIALRVYIAPNSEASFNDAFNQIVVDNVAGVTSNSWGSCEPLNTLSEANTLTNIFSQGATQGQSFFSAAGDGGAYDCGFLAPTVGLAVDVPADNPYMVGVGGTTLTADTTTGAYTSETAWSCPAPTCTDRGVNGDGGGGGLSGANSSFYFVKSTFDNGPNVVNQYSTGARQVPDVSADADPNTGYSVYFGGAWYSGGGTSAAAPLWAATTSVMEQYLNATYGARALGYTRPYLYEMVNTAQPYTAFHDITTGNNLYYSAAAGYDLASGLGTPDAYNLARDLAANIANFGQVENTSTTWYFAEGYTGGSFTTYLTLANPYFSPAHVSVTYLLGNSPTPIVKPYTVNAQSRKTLNVNTEIGVATGVSMVVSSDVPIVAERPMYFTYTVTGGSAVPGGTDVLGATALGTQFDFGYVDTTANHDTYFTVLNQNTSTMTVTMDLFPAAGGSPDVVTGQVPPNQRGTFKVNTQTVNGTPDVLPAGVYTALVTLSEPGLVERPMYLIDSTTGYTGAADVVGVGTALTTWYFAEGYVSPTFSERYILSNPTTGTTIAHATVTFYGTSGSGALTSQSVTLAPGQQAVVNANSVLASIGTSVSNSATVTSDAPILAERFMSFEYTGPVGTSSTSNIPGATDALGGAHTGYQSFFAEGYTNQQFAEYLTIENPDPSQTAYVLVWYLPANGSAAIVKSYHVSPQSRLTIFTNNELPPQSFSMVVQSGVPVLAERPMYFAYNGSQTGGTDVVGYQPS